MGRKKDTCMIWFERVKIRIFTLCINNWNSGIELALSSVGKMRVNQ